MRTAFIVLEEVFSFRETLSDIARNYAEFNFVGVRSPEADSCTAIFEQRDTESILMPKPCSHRTNLPRQ